MIVPLVLGWLASAPLEIGGSLGMGRLLGDGVASDGRSTEVFEAVRTPTSGSVWLGYEWMPGYLVGIRYLRWKATGAVDGVGDLGTGAFEDLSVQVYGFSFARRWPMGPTFLRLEGGAGFATSTDELSLSKGDIRAEGEGSGYWLRSEVELPIDPVGFHLGGVYLWTPFSAMRSESVDSYKSDFAVLQLEAAVSVRF